MYSHLFYLKSNVKKTFISTIMCIFSVNISFAAQPDRFLTLEDVEQIALSRDFLVESFIDKSNSLQQESIALNTLPDPKLKLGLLNYPVDTFKANQEPMTQKKIGIIQMFPKGNSLGIKSERAIIEGRPLWATISFALAVFGGVVGSLFLLLKKSISFYVFILSLLGVIITMTHSLGLFGSTISFSVAELLGIILMPLAIAVFLIWYAQLAKNKTWTK